MGVVSRKSKASTRPAAERVTFFACAKKDNQRNTPPVMRSPGILPSESTRALRGSLDVHPCTFSERPRIVRGLLRTFPPRTRRITGGPLWAASCRRSQSQSQSSPPSHLDVVQGCTDSWINGAVRGAEHRRRGGKMPAGSRRWIAAIAKQYTDVLSEQPRRAEKHRAVRFARCESDHRVRGLAFLVTFWAMPKSNRLAAGETKLCNSKKGRRLWVPASDGMTPKPKGGKSSAGSSQCAG
jgi:hypothetical protein